MPSDSRVGLAALEPAWITPHTTTEYVVTCQECPDIHERFITIGEAQARCRLHNEVCHGR